MKVLLLDPSLFTGPYDASLNEGLVAAGVQPRWLTRPTRRGDRQEIPAQYVEPIFYKHVDDAAAFPKAVRTLVKGLAHLVGLGRMLGAVWRHRPEVIHVQWVVIPPVDLVVLWVLKRFCPIVLTVHDTVPFNGERISLLQNLGFHGPIKLASHVIVHTQAGRQALIRHGIDADKIAVIPHGPLKVHAVPEVGRPVRDPRWTFVLFGELKPYKGIDLLIEAVGLLTPAIRAQIRVVIAGRERMDLAPLKQRIAELSLMDTIEFRPQRQSNQEMANLFDDTDTFVFPYRQIDASGVYFLVKSLNRWLIASRVGIFAEDLREGEQGTLIPLESPQALASAMEESMASRRRPAPLPTSGTWLGIGESTKQIYGQAVSAHRARLQGSLG